MTNITFNSISCFFKMTILGYFIAILSVSKAHANSIICSQYCFYETSTIDASVGGGVINTVTLEECTDWLDELNNFYKFNCKIYKKNLKGKSTHSDYPSPVLASDKVSDEDFIFQLDKITNIQLDDNLGIDIVCSRKWSDISPNPCSRKVIPLNLPLSERHKILKLLCKSLKVKCSN